jgi:glucosamine kinase
MREPQVDGASLFLGVDGGGTRCRARLCDRSGAVLGEGIAGPANVRLGVDDGMKAVLDAAGQCLAQAGLGFDTRPIVACLALAGASEPVELKAAQTYPHPFRQMIVTTDAHAACVGAHRGQDGGVIIVGTGSVAWATLAGRHHRVGGWGFPISDEGSGAWIGCEAVRRVLWAYDGRAPWTGLLRDVFEEFDSDPHAIVRWMSAARPRDFAALAPMVVGHARQADAAGRELLDLAAGHIDVLAERLHALGVQRIALSGGLSSSIGPLLGQETKCLLVPAAADALAGALWLALSATSTNRDAEYLYPW